MEFNLFNWNSRTKTLVFGFIILLLGLAVGTIIAYSFAFTKGFDYCIETAKKVLTEWDLNSIFEAFKKLGFF